MDIRTNYCPFSIRDIHRYIAKIIASGDIEVPSMVWPRTKLHLTCGTTR